MPSAAEGIVSAVNLGGKGKKGETVSALKSSHEWAGGAAYLRRVLKAWQARWRGSVPLALLKL